MSRDKLVNPDEFDRWWNEGKSYQWIVDEYQRKYDIEITPSTIGNWRARRGLERRQQTDLSLLPWKIERQHRYKHAPAMLRAEGRRRAGMPLSELQTALLNNWLRFMADEDCVVHYDPETEEGFFYVPRRKGVDTDLIRKPPHPTRQRGIRE